VRLGDDSQGADGSQVEGLGGSAYREVVGQQQGRGKLRAEQEALPVSCLQPFQPMLCRESGDLVSLKGVTLRECEHGPDRRRPVGLLPDALGDVEVLEDREEGQATDFREMDQWAGVGDCS